MGKAKILDSAPVHEKTDETEQLTLFIDNIPPTNSAVIETYLAWLEDGGRTWWQRVNVQPRQMLVSPRDQLLTTHSFCYWHAEWKGSVWGTETLKTQQTLVDDNSIFFLKYRWPTFHKALFL